MALVGRYSRGQLCEVFLTKRIEVSDTAFEVSGTAFEVGDPVFEVSDTAFEVSDTVFRHKIIYNFVQNAVRLRVKKKKKNAITIIPYGNE